MADWRQKPETGFNKARDIPKAITLLIAVAVLVFGLLAAAQTIRLTLLVSSPLLQLDEWRVLPRYIQFMSGELGLLSFLWEDHFGHRPALTRLLFILDAEATGATQALTRTVSVVLCVLLIALFAMVLARQKQLSPGLKLLGIGLIAVVLLPTQQIHNLSIGWNNTILTAVFFSVLALHLVLVSIERDTTVGGGGLWLAGALGCGLLSTYSMANGLLIWPIMMLVCIRFRRWRHAVIVAAFGTAVGLSYLWNSQRTGMLLNALTQPAELISYAITFLGNFIYLPFLPPNRSAAIFGCIALLLVVYHFVRQTTRAGEDRYAVWLFLGVCLFSVGTAGLTAWGRIRFGAEVGLEPGAIVPVQLRYYSFTAPLWASAVALSVLSLQRSVSERARGPMPILDAFAFIVSCAVCAAIYLTSPSAAQLVEYIKRPLERDAAAIVSGAPDQQAMKHIYPFPDVDVPSLVPYLVDRRLSIFQSEADRILYARAHHTLQRPIFEAAATNVRCAVRIEELSVMERAAGDQSGWHQLQGAILGPKADAGLYGILFADEEGKVVGIGRLTQVTTSDRDGQLRRLPYLGYVETRRPASVVGYLLERGQDNPCRLDRKPPAH